jgi:hypothetical protein
MRIAGNIKPFDFRISLKKETIEGKMGLKLNGWFEIC